MEMQRTGKLGRQKTDRIPTLSQGSKMSQLLTRVAALKSDKKGVTALEYGLIAALIAVAIITSVTLLGTNLAATFTNVASQMGTTTGTTTTPAK
jgi:pilus assembly protein Flp/PilA